VKNWLRTSVSAKEKSLNTELNKKEKLPPVKNKSPKHKEFADQSHQNQDNKKTIAVYKDPWLVDSNIEVF
jgi:hypothetical protein